MILKHYWKIHFFQIMGLTQGLYIINSCFYYRVESPVCRTTNNYKIKDYAIIRRSTIKENNSTQLKIYHELNLFISSIHIIFSVIALIDSVLNHWQILYFVRSISKNTKTYKSFFTYNWKSSKLKDIQTREKI